MDKIPHNTTIKNKYVDPARSLYESIIDSCDDAIISKNLDGTITSWNKGAEDLFGYSKDEAIGKHISIIIPKDYLAEETEIIDKIKKGIKIKPFHAKRVTKHGAIIDITVSVSPILNHQGEIIGAAKIISDISDIIRAEEKVTKADQNYRRVVENINDGLMIDDLSGKIVFANEQFMNLFGLVRGDLENIVLEDYVAPEFHQLLRDRHNRRVAGEEVPSEFQYIGIRKNGERRWMNVRVSKIVEDGLIKGTQTAIRDITDHKLAEEKLIESEKLHRKIVENLPRAIITIIDRDEKYILAEGEGLKLLGLTKDDYLNQNALAALGDDVTATVKELRQKAFDGQLACGDIKVNGRYFIVRCIPLFDENNYIHSLLNISLDITDIKQAENHILELKESLEKKVAERTLQLELANKELEAFSYSVSHDLRAPLRIINGFADILISDYGDKLDEDGAKMLERIMNNTQRMGRLIDELINLARVGRKEMALHPTDMNEIVANAIEEQIALIKKPIDIIKEDLPVVTCDSGLLSHVWSNLVSNAIKYSGKNEYQLIQIKCHAKDHEIIFSISDNGVGFDMEFKDKLFGVFQRLHKKHEFEGTGIGLALVKRIILRHGGSVWAEAETNKGATFYFSLPG